MLRAWPRFVRVGGASSWCGGGEPRSWPGRGLPVAVVSHAECNWLWVVGVSLDAGLVASPHPYRVRGRFSLRSFSQAPAPCAIEVVPARKFESSEAQWNSCAYLPSFDEIRIASGACAGIGAADFLCVATIRFADGWDCPETCEIAGLQPDFGAQIAARDEPDVSELTVWFLSAVAQAGLKVANASAAWTLSSRSGAGKRFLSTPRRPYERHWQLIPGMA